VYEGSNLQYINFEEGRIRVIQPASLSNGYDALAIDGNMDLPDGKKGVYDYFIRDYQENVRMILSEESHYSLGQCTMETARAGNEEPVFGQTGGGNEVSVTRTGKPSGWNSNSSSSVSKLSKLTGNTIGPNSLLKVMAGDELNARADYYYQSPVANNSNSLLTDIVNTLVQAISGSTAASAPVKGGTSGISANLNASVPLANVSDPHRYTTDNIPRAYLNILFFDERFNFVPENSTAVRVSQSGDGAAPLVLPANIKAPKNGFAYIYVSNENDDAVYFDNLQVSDNRGRMIEENHYYAFGLKIAGISSKKLGDIAEGMLDNKNLYNDKELIDEADLDWYDYGFRNYDPQIGRFPQLDPLTDDYPYYTPYQYAGNEPIGNVDLDGLEELNVLGEIFQGAKNAIQPTVTVVGRAAPAITKAGQKIGGEIIKQAFKQGWKLTLKAGLRAAPLLVSFLASPLEAGNARPTGAEPRGMHWGGDQYVFNQLPNEQITNDPSTLSDDYLRGVEERLTKGTATVNDYKYQQEIARRKKAGGFGTGGKTGIKYSIKSRDYDRPMIHTYSGNAVRQKDALNDWNEFLGPNQTNIDPRDGLPDPDRIWSVDGKRSIRFGAHEYNSKPSKLHYHRETWYSDRVENVLQRVQK
jgi:RHS repeat-associated protein